MTFYSLLALLSLMVALPLMAFVRRKLTKSALRRNQALDRVHEIRYRSQKDLEKLVAQTLCDRDVLLK